MTLLSDKRSSLQAIFKKLIHGSGAALANRLLWIPTALYLSTLITNGLGDREAGLYFFSFSLIGVVSYLAQFGLARASLKIVSSHLARNELSLVRSSILNAFFIILGMGCMLLLLFEFGFIELLTNYLIQYSDLKYLGLALGLWVIFTAVQALASELFRAFKHPGLAFFFGGLMWRILLVATLVIMSYSTFLITVKEVVYIAVFVTGISSFIGLLIIYNKIKNMPKGGQISKLNLVKVGLPMMFAGLSGIIITNACILVLAIFQAPEEVAKLNIAFRLAALGSLPIIVIGAVIPSYIVELYERKKTHDLETLLRVSASVSAFCSMIITIIYYFWGKEILETFFGPGYEQAYYALMIFSLGYFLQALNGPIHFTLDMIGYHKIAAMSAVVCTIINVIGCFIFAPIYGIEGVATVTACAMALQLFIMTTTLIIKERINPFAYLIGPSISENKEF